VILMRGVVLLLFFFCFALLPSSPLNLRLNSRHYSAIGANNVLGTSRFPRPLSNTKKIGLEFGSNTEFVNGPAKDYLRKQYNATFYLKDKCRSTNNFTCSGHGNCSLDSANVFAIGHINVKNWVCICDKGWFGSACHLKLNAAESKAKLKTLKKLLNSPAAGSRKGAIVYNPGDKTFLTHTEPSPGSTFGRIRVSHEKIPGRRMPGFFMDKNQPGPTTLDSWALPREQSLFQGGKMMAEWERTRLSVQMIPDDYLTQTSPRLLYSKTVALYTNPKGKTIEGPLIRPDQLGKPVFKPQDVRIALPPDPTTTKVRDVLNGSRRY